ncbi:hypothetical protein HPP92_016261 [Vanilla planifolia]|uniref:BTB domain-containing protein n=1 Tax=Vanilla planifolia TaxID=51239 RepID=A0A835UQI1_VANPL|nr:hypothetical protein HPP92_016883 [Vanilla planifolia]KAG0471715.1 hypothetical protein HPP92_016261 [Vanilla planifolia]
MEDDSLNSLSMDFLNLLLNGESFSDVTFSVDGRLIPAHRCILAARSLFFRRLFYAPDPLPNLHLHPDHTQPRRRTNRPFPASAPGAVVPVANVRYDAFLLLLQFLYSGQISLFSPKHDPTPNFSSTLELALDTLAAARSFAVDHLALLVQKQLEVMVEKASVEEVMVVLLAARKHDLPQLWSTCTALVAKSGLLPEILAKHLPLDAVAKVEELRLKSALLPLHATPTPDDHHHHRIRRMRRALDSSDVELVKLMVVGEGLNLDEALALHYAVRNCTREVVKALLELGAADVNRASGPSGKTPLHLAAEMVSPDMVSVLLDHHADPNVRTTDGVTPLDVLRSLTSDFLFRGTVPGLAHVEPNKLRLCLELVQSAAMVLSREEAAAASATAMGSRGAGVDLDSRMLYLNLGRSQGFDPSFLCPPHDPHFHR